MSTFETSRKQGISTQNESRARGRRLALTASMAIALTLGLSPQRAEAARGGGGASGFFGGDSEFGIVGGVTQSTQDALNLLITRANSRTGAGPITTAALNSAYELGAQFGYRISGTIFTVLFRPSYFLESTTGTGTDGSYNYNVSGITFFPILRMIPLENDIMKFFLNIGLGYGRATTKIEEGPRSVEAVGDAFGTLIGLGAEFCITGSQCISFEGNYRYLSMDRNIVTSSTGTWDASNSLSQATANRELELDGDDLKIRMGGMQFLAGYIIHF